MAAIARTRWQFLSPLLDRLLDAAPADRDAMLAGIAKDDATVAEELRRLLTQSAALRDDEFPGIPPLSRPGISEEGQSIGPYTLVAPIGRGGMGTVWRARRSDGRFDGTVAIKLLNPGLMGRSAEARFLQEGSIQARLRHPHIAQLLDAGVTRFNQPYLVLEHVDGEHIDEYCRRHALGVDARVRLFLDVLAAVAHAHANLIVHRDIKPSNVLVRADGQVKLLDFGIARFIEQDGLATAADARVLTPEYAAPEQVTGAPITTATDVYALGMLLYVLLGGRRPTLATERLSPAALIKAIVETDLPRLSTVAPDARSLRGDLETIVAKALKKAPSERYASAAALADDLRRYLQRQPVLARPDTLRYRGARFVQRHARGVIASAVVLAMTTALVAFYTARLSAERDRARLEATKSAQVSELLTTLLTGADPYASGAEPTVRGLLDAGAERVDQALSAQPAVRAEMLTIIGRVYLRLGAYDRAQPLLERAVALARAQGARTASVAQALSDLGVLLRERGEAAGAIPLLEESLTIRAALNGREDKDVAVTLVELGRAYQDHGAPERAEPLLREALQIRRDLFGERHRETATSESALALLLWNRGDIDAAAPLFRASLDTSRALLGPDHPNVATSLNNLGLVLLDTGDYAAAEAMFRESLAIKTRQFGDDHQSLCPTLSNLAAALREQRRYAEARLLLERALAIGRERLGAEHPSLSNYEVNLARVHLALHEDREAETLLRDALARQQRSAPENDWRLAATKGLLGTLLLQHRDYAAAEPLLTEASAVLADVPGRQGREAALTRASLAELHRVRRRRPADTPR